ncbi:DoxX family protein [Moraxella sp. ZJ142]|uniref:DoxX family protein n=1 Tax=Moraxella marmotae TaxID=3344520 RepID=UPI0035D4BDF5
MKQTLNQYQPYAQALLRIAVGYAFILHGTAKFFEFPVSMTDGNGAVPLFSLFGVAALLELVFGALFLLGLKTRLVAFLLSGQMAVAYFMMHFSPFPMTNGGEAAYLFCFIFFYFIFAGGGAWALDNHLSKK